MRSAVVEFVGGPRDGEIVEVADWLVTLPTGQLMIEAAIIVGRIEALAMFAMEETDLEPMKNASPIIQVQADGTIVVPEEDELPAFWCADDEED